MTFSIKIENKNPHNVKNINISENNQQHIKGSIDITRNPHQYAYRRNIADDAVSAVVHRALSHLRTKTLMTLEDDLCGFQEAFEATLKVCSG